jgi:RNA-directed DNA polymerase
MADGVVQERTEGTPQGGPLSPLLSNILLDDLDKELERRGHRFCRYADDCNIYVKSEAAGQRVMESITGFLEKRLRLKVNRDKSAVARPGKRTFLGYTIMGQKSPRLKASSEAVRRLKGRLKKRLRKGRGQAPAKLIAEISPLLRGRVNYFKLASVRSTFETLDQWLRRKIRCILWRQWKQPRTRARKLMERGIEKERAWSSATNGRGAWWNAGASHMNAAITLTWFSQQGLVSLREEHRRLNHPT